MDDEDKLPLEEYVKLPSTVDFQVINTPRFREYARDKPYLHFGTELANNYMIVYTNEKYIKGLLMDLGSDFLSFYPKIMSPLDSISNDRINHAPDPHMNDHSDRHWKIIFSVYDRGNSESQSYQDTSDNHLCKTIIIQTEISFVTDIEHHSDQTEYRHGHTNTDN